MILSSFSILLWSLVSYCFEGLAVSQVTHLLFCASQSGLQKKVGTFTQDLQ